jgi:hypothetical protein
VTIALAPELEKRVQVEATRTGISADLLVNRLVDEHFAQQDNAIADEDDDPYWEKEFFERLDAERPEGQKLFPPELKGISW